MEYVSLEFLSKLLKLQLLILQGAVHSTRRFVDILMFVFVAADEFSIDYGHKGLLYSTRSGSPKETPKAKRRPKHW